jgi:hypothetical protein
VDNQNSPSHPSSALGLDEISASLRPEETSVQPATIPLWVLARWVALVPVLLWLGYLGVFRQVTQGGVLLDLKLGQWMNQRREIPQEWPFGTGLESLAETLGPGQPWLHQWMGWLVFQSAGWWGVYGVAVSAFFASLFVGMLWLRAAQASWSGTALGVLTLAASWLTISAPGPDQWTLALLGLVSMAVLPSPARGIGLVLSFVGLILWPHFHPFALGAVTLVVFWALSDFFLQPTLPKPSWWWWAGSLVGMGLFSAIIMAVNSLGSLMTLAPPLSLPVWVLALPALAGLLLVRSCPARRLGWATLAGIFAGLIPASALGLVWALLFAAFQDRFSPKAWSNRWWGFFALVLGFAFFQFSAGASDRGPRGLGLDSSRFPEMSATLLARVSGGGVLIHDARDSGFFLWRLWPEWKQIPAEARQRSLSGDFSDLVQRRVRALSFRHNTPQARWFAQHLAENRQTTNSLSTLTGTFVPIHMDDLGWLALRQDLIAFGSHDPFRILIPGLPWDEQLQLVRSQQDWLDLGADIRRLTLDQPGSPLVNQYLQVFLQTAPEWARYH